MTWWHYLLLVNLYLLLFYGFYALLLRNETFFQLNRAYLVAGALLSFIIPVIQANWIKQLFITQRVQQTLYSTIYHPEFVYQAKPAEGFTLTIGQAFALIYIGGTIFLLARFFFQLLSVKKLLHNLESSAAFSFFNKVKIDDALPGQQTILEHEQVHVNQWHSADVLFIEAVMIINWFNPIVYFYRKAIKHVHEFIADKKAIERGTSKTEYAYLLLSQTFGANPHQLTNNFFNKSLLKQRIIMLNKDESKRRKLLKYGLSAPLFVVMLILSSATVKNSSVLRIINKKTDQIFLMNTMPGKQIIKDIMILPHESVSAPQVVLKQAEIKADLTDSAAMTEEPANTQSEKIAKLDNTVFTAVEIQPEFPGGEPALGKFLQANLKYPKLAHENGVQGKVYLQFVVQKDGNLDDMKVLRDPGSGLGEEALRVLSESPKWRPGIQNGRTVKVQFTIPINFKLNTDNGPVTDTQRVTGMVKNISVIGYRSGTRMMDTANMPKSGTKVIYVKHSSADMNNAIFYVNGKELPAEQALAIKPDRIENILVTSVPKDQANNDKLKKAVIAIVLKDTKADHE